ncbi:uncharacterized protein LOC133294951 [Gastrolobium bilobum]|uniref:uncharacterized protein LOC133294951 n=1 Tax=Gastrolobium bilobum TaxID=150636 RepID=UPI002AB1DD58|nr:uncharacterized protein LOC133294951 [Gastrolobium bilobum]
MLKDFMARNDAIVQSQSASIKNLENQVGQLADAMRSGPIGTLPSNTGNPRREGSEQIKAITLRNGKTVDEPDHIKDYHKMKELESQNAGEKVVVEEDVGEQQVDTQTKSLEQNAAAKKQYSQPADKASRPPPPFPQRFMDVLEQLHINVPLVEALEQMPSYAKFMKDILSRKKDSKKRKAQPPKPSIEEPPLLELKPLPDHLRYAYLGENDTLPVIISSHLTKLQEGQLLDILKKHKTTLGWTIADIKGISPSLCMHKILLEEGYNSTVQHQRRLNPMMKEVVKKKVIKWLDARVIYPISDSQWVSPVQCVPKTGGITVVENENNELISTRTVTGWRICMDYRKLNDTTRKDHFPLPFIDQMLDRLAGKEFYCFLDGYSGYNQIAIAPEDQDKTTFICPYGTFAFIRMPFGLGNAPATFQCCMMAIFTDMVEDFVEIFMDDFSVFGESFDSCLANLSDVLQRREDTNLILN